MGLRATDLLLPVSAGELPQRGLPREYVYGMADAQNDNIVKIGFTSDPVARTKALNSQTAALGFLCPLFWFVCDSARLHEQRIFQVLASYRVRPNKEFFKLKPIVACVYLSWYFERPPDYLSLKHQREFSKLHEKCRAGRAEFTAH
jgi:hypothetical protein